MFKSKHFYFMDDKAESIEMMDGFPTINRQIYRSS